MSKFFYFRLALTNIKQNRKTYGPYLLTCTITAAMYYLIHSLANNPGFGTGETHAVLGLGVRITAIFAVVFLFYTNSFLLKRRKKEFGLYNILGMEKKHLSRVIFWETFDVAACSLALGILAGVLLDRLMFLIILRLVQADISLDYQLSLRPVLSVLILFGVIYLVIFLNSIRQIHVAKPAELLQGGNVGEKEPKARWFLAVLGAACLAGGYYISVTTTNPILALTLFFLAVVLVIAGTYLIFMTGSIALLKMLRKKKNYYYQPKHFVGISGMIYRMKQNACGLANICVLSTMTLVMVAATLSMWLNMNEILEQRYPAGICASVNREQNDTSVQIDSWIDEQVKKQGLELVNPIHYTNLSFTVLENGMEFITEEPEDLSLLSEINQLRNLYFVSLEDYNRMASQKESLKPDEVLFYANREPYGASGFRVFGKEFQIKEVLKEFPVEGMVSANVTSSYYIVVPDLQHVARLFQAEQEWDGRYFYYRDYYAFDLEADDETVMEFYTALRQKWMKEGISGTLECRIASRQDMLETYGSLFFIGIFLGALFIMATVLIIYYKQISEGYEDKKRFEILQKVGMDQAAVRKTIKSQILTVFFLPLITAGVHMAFAFPAVSRVLALLNMTDVRLLAACCIGCFLVFTVFYILIYSATAGSYYRIVSNGKERGCR